MERSEQRRRTRQVALRLCDGRLLRQNIGVIRGNIETFIKLSQRFRKTTKIDIVNRVVGKQGNAARVEPLGFVEVGFASVPLAPPACDQSERFRNQAAIRQQRSC